MEAAPHTGNLFDDMQADLAALRITVGALLQQSPSAYKNLKGIAARFDDMLTMSDYTDEQGERIKFRFGEMLESVALAQEIALAEALGKVKI